MVNIDEARYEQLVQSEAILGIIRDYVFGSEYINSPILKIMLGRNREAKEPKVIEEPEVTEDDVYQDGRCCDNCTYYNGPGLCINTLSANLRRITRNGSDCCLWKPKEVKNEQD